MIQQDGVTNYDLFWGYTKRPDCLLSVASATNVEGHSRIVLKASELPTVYPNATVNGHPINEVMHGRVENVSLIAASTLVGIDGTVMLGRRPGPELVTGYPWHLTLFGGRCSENPAITFEKELLEELFIEIVPSGEAIYLAPFDSASLRAIATASARQCGHDNPRWRKLLISSMPEFAGYSVQIELSDEEGENRIQIALPNTGCFFDPSLNTYELIRGINLSLPDAVARSDLRAKFLENPEHTLEWGSPEGFLNNKLTFTARTALSIVSPDFFEKSDSSGTSRLDLEATR